MIIILFFMVIVGAALEYWTVKHSLDGVSHEHSPSQNMVEPEEIFYINSTVTNHSFSFQSFIEVSEHLPEEFVLEDGITHKYSLFLMPYQRYNRSIPVKACERGCYTLKGAMLIGGDFLGIKETYMSAPQSKEVVVIPALYNESFLLRTLGSFLGDISVNRFIMEDPVLTMGFREYTGREPFKMIAWNQTARNRQLMVKKYDYTLELTVTVLLNVGCKCNTDTDSLVETCFSIARTVCETLESKHIKYSFITNAYINGSVSKWDSLNDGLGNSHLMAILEGLGRATYDEYVRPFNSLLKMATKKAELGRSHIIITPQGIDDYQQSINQLKSLTGGSVLILSPKEEVVL